MRSTTSSSQPQAGNEPRDSRRAQSARRPGESRGKSDLPFFLSVLIFGLLIAVAGPASGGEITSQQVAAVPSATDETAERHPDTLDLTLPPRAVAPNTAPVKTKPSNPTATVEVTRHLRLHGAYRLELALYPDDLQPAGGRPPGQ